MRVPHPSGPGVLWAGNRPSVEFRGWLFYDRQAGGGEQIFFVTGGLITQGKGEIQVSFIPVSEESSASPLPAF